MTGSPNILTNADGRAQWLYVMGAGGGDTNVDGVFYVSTLGVEYDGIYTAQTPMV